MSVISSLLKQGSGRRSPNATLRLGLVPMTDSAPLIVAQEFELFARRGLWVSLTRELG